MLTIEEATKKYSSGDDAYALKLKEGIRGALGYSNYQAKLKGAVEAPINTGDVSKMDPATIAAHRNSVMGINQDQIDTYGKITNQIDSVAGSLAAAQAAREKAAAAKAKTDNPLGLREGDWLDEQIKNFMLDKPLNSQGQPMSVDEFKQSLLARKAMFSENPIGEGDMFQPGITAEMVKQRISEVVPTDYSKRSEYYRALSAGATKADATDIQDFSDYSSGRMSTGKKLVYEMLNPSVANKAEAKKQEDSILVKADERIEDEKGKRPKYSIDEIIKDNPDVPATETTRIVKKSMEKDVADDVKEQYLSNNLEKVKAALASNEYDVLAKDEEFKKFKINLAAAYADYYSSAEIDNLVYKIINEQL